MKLRIDRCDQYIAVVVEDVGEAVLRRFPWPDNANGRMQKFNEACEYANRVGEAVLCPIEIAIDLEIAVECARLGLTQHAPLRKAA